MLPRTKSIFHLDAGDAGEEGGHPTAIDSTIRPVGGPSNKYCRAPESLQVGLRILIHHHHHPGRASDVVIRPAVKCSRAHGKYYPSAAPDVHHHQLGFLKACYLCKRELSPHKDVYMYRGDQGFCSIECRCKQILLDERSELEGSARDRFGVPHHHRSGVKLRESARRRRISVVA